MTGTESRMCTSGARSGSLLHVPQPSIAQLLGRAANDAQRLVQGHVALAKTELQESASKIGATGIFGLAAVALVAQGATFLLIALAFVFVALGLPLWAGFLIVAGILFLGAVITVLLARNSARGIAAPMTAVAEIGKTREALLPAPDAGQAPAT